MTADPYYQSKYATAYPDSYFLISPDDVVANTANQNDYDDDDEEILALLSSLDNGSSTDDEDTASTEKNNWNVVVKQFKATCKISLSDWQQVLKRVEEMKRVQPTKKVTLEDLVTIAKKIKNKRKQDKQEKD